MTETPFTSPPMPDPDDDRLLAHVLGLETDSELAAASEMDDTLRHRLDALRADVAEIAEGVAHAVPEPDEGYTDLHQARWAKLSEAISGDGDGVGAAPRAALGRGHSPSHGTRHWLRVFVPAFAAVVLLAVGAAALQQLRPVASTLESTADKAAEQGTDTSGAIGEDLRAPATAESAQQYDNVVVARARAARNGSQRFDVVRVLRGEAPERLRLHVVSAPAAAGRLHVLLYDEPAPSGRTPTGPLFPDGTATLLRLLVLPRAAAVEPATGLPQTSPPSSAPVDDRDSGGGEQDSASRELVFHSDLAIHFRNGTAVVALPLPREVAADEIALP